MSTNPIVRLADDLYEARMQANEAIRQRDEALDALQTMADAVTKAAQILRRRKDAPAVLASIQEEA